MPTVHSPNREKVSILQALWIRVSLNNQADGWVALKSHALWSWFAQFKLPKSSRKAWKAFLWCEIYRFFHSPFKVVIVWGLSCTKNRAPKDVAASQNASQQSRTSKFHGKPCLGSHERKQLRFSIRNVIKSEETHERLKKETWKSGKKLAEQHSKLIAALKDFQ